MFCYTEVSDSGQTFVIAGCLGYGQRSDLVRTGGGYSVQTCSGKKRDHQGNVVEQTSGLNRLFCNYCFFVGLTVLILLKQIHFIFSGRVLMIDPYTVATPSTPGPIA